MDRRQRRFVPRMEGSLEDRVVLSAGAAHAHVRNLTGGTIPVLSWSTYQDSVYKIELAFRSYRGQSQVGADLGALWHSLTHERWTWPGGNKPNDITALRNRVFMAVSQIPYAPAQLMPRLDSEMNPATMTKQSSRGVQNQVLNSLRVYIHNGVVTELFLMKK
jgi:hypothetical protein